ncbi:MAG: cytidylate kinase-like family protein [Pseudomonadota bacterium]|uniref:Cytidylate kinase-like family protein n=1 Tax=Candidatus Desulfatibia profunda TaxID=2841695 RepID=A0A8J6NUT3_9BACT|nr:cytidylate kinase-like family protein [Candidatus Desulfatibia profunda]MBU0698162.1 cytidylate kinase-like family protein [Pseudomonadota bacterium]
MSKHTEEIKYIPGTYAKKRQTTAKLAQHYISDWDKTRIKIKAKDKQTIIPPTICFSRKIGVGVLEIADILSKKIGYRVVDRQLIEHIAKEGKLREATVAYFDERYPGIRNEFAALIVGEKSFIMSDYSKHLFNVVFSIAGMEPTIFVGRGTHLILPRDRVLAVRVIGTKDYRSKRLARILKVDEKEVVNTLDEVDREQRNFFKKIFGKKDALAYEFDLVINCDYIHKPEWAANIVMQAFKDKFS